MNRLSIVKVGFMLVAPLLLSGCIDDDYDLSDIDGTVELQVKDLTIPMNLDDIKLTNIIEISENGQIKIVDDKYVIIEDGEFDTDEIEVPMVEIAAPVVEPTITKLELNAPEIPNIPNIPNIPMADLGIDISELHYTLESNVSEFEYVTHSVSDYIMSIDKIGTDLKVEMIFDLVGLDIVKSFSLRNFELQLPKGLTLTLTTEKGVYDPETGILSIEDGPHAGHSLDFIMMVSEIDIEKSGITYDHDTHTIEFKDHIGIHSGEIVVTDDDVDGTILDMLINGTFPQTINLKSEYLLSNILVKTFTGDIRYTLDAMDIAPIKINNLPDVLAQDETNIVLANPQVYVSLNNPLAKYGVYAQSGLAITSQWPNASKTASLDNGVFTISGTEANPLNVFCMSPTLPENYYSGYENAEHIPFSGLAEVLSGDGLPSSLKVALENPNVPVQHVEDFVLGEKLGAVQGTYTFYTPLELGVNSRVVYSSTEDGWNDEEVDAITIKLMEVSALVTNNLPLDIEITGYPIDVNGNQIDDVEIEGMSVSANAVDQPVNIRIAGNITHLDGIYFRAVAEANENSSALKPSAHIQLKDLRVKISGNYIDEL